MKQENINSISAASSLVINLVICISHIYITKGTLSKEYLLEFIKHNAMLLFALSLILYFIINKNIYYCVTDGYAFTLEDEKNYSGQNDDSLPK